MSTNKLYGMILAGGSGSRLWPLSRELYPKQLLNLIGNNTLLQSTFSRIEKLISPENIITVTNKQQQKYVELQLNSSENNYTAKIIGEPTGRNTAPAIGLASMLINQEDKDAIIFVTPSDHLIKQEQAFIDSIRAGIEIAEKGNIVTFGITPSSPETGYGYIKADTENEKILKVQEFKEKPDLETAKKYLECGNYFWNSGMFMFKASTILEELQKHAPEVYTALQNVDLNNITKESYEKIPSISIDYAVMEKSDKIALIPVDCGWSDLGSWSAIWETADKDTNNNYKRGNVFDIETQNSLIFSDKRIVATIGVNNLTIVDTDDAVLICNNEKTQDVKKVFEKLKSDKNSAYLQHKTTQENWGTCKSIEKNNDSESNYLVIEPGKTLKGFSANFKKHIVVTKGSIELIIQNNKETLNSLDSKSIDINTDYELINSSGNVAELIEVNV